MKVVLFCGGLGTRLRDLSGGVPKPMVKIGPQPILWHIMKYYSHFGHSDFILCLGYKADIIKEYFLNHNKYISSNIVITKNKKKYVLREENIVNWKLTLVDTGLRSSIGERLKAVEPYLEGEEMFLANYADGLSNLHLPDMIEYFEKSAKIACFACVKPIQTFHVVDIDNRNIIKRIKLVKDADIFINGGFFIFRREIFKYIKHGEDLIVEPFQRLINKGQLIGYKFEKFWYCMDTFKEHQELSDMFDNCDAPWMLWKKSKTVTL